MKRIDIVLFETKRQNLNISLLYSFYSREKINMLIDQNYRYLNYLKLCNVICLSFFTFFFIHGCSSNAVSGKISGFSNLVLDKDVYDFGNINPGGARTAVFNLSNVGDEPLFIYDVQKCCGAIITLDKYELTPGEKGVLTAEYRAGQSGAMFNKVITLVTNDPKNPQKILTIKGQIVPTLEWSPKNFKVSAFQKDAGNPEITIKSLNNTPFSIKGFVSTSQCLSADFDSLQKATEFILKPKADMEKLNKLETNQGVVVIELEHPDYTSISVPFDLIQSLQAVPPQILAFGVKVNEPITRTLELRDNTAIANTNISEQIESVTSANGTKVEVLEKKMNGAGCMINLKIQPSVNGNSESAESFSNDKLVIKMKDGRQLSVPVRIFYESQTLSSRAN